MRKTKNNTAEKENIRFEDALEQLEIIVKKLEKGDVSLEDALEQFSIGMNMSEICLDKLNMAEKQIDLIIQEKNGKIIADTLQIQEDGVCR